MSLDFALINKVADKANRLLDRLNSSQNPVKYETLDDEALVFRWCTSKGLTPIQWESSIAMDDLLHLDEQAKLLFTNTQQFIEGNPANNVLLWGARGTGKSSLIQAVLANFSKKPLQILEIGISQFRDWPQIASQLLACKSQKFIIFCDDLSFNENDSSYKEIKAALDGSLMSLPSNALIYATSNRRHLLPEKLADNNAIHKEGEIHHSEAVEEAISLSDRFGLWLSFHAFSQEEYLNIVEHWLKKFGVQQELLAYRELALRWALQRGSRSGRIANQFARDYAGKFLLKSKQS